MDFLDFQAQRAAILSDPSTSYWLKDALEALTTRDAVDALSDAEVLADLANLRLKEIQTSY